MAGAHGAERRHAGRPEGDLRDRIGVSVVLSFLVVRVFVFLLQNWILICFFFYFFVVRGPDVIFQRDQCEE